MGQLIFLSQINEIIDSEAVQPEPGQVNIIVHTPVVATGPWDTFRFCRQMSPATPPFCPPAHLVDFASKRILDKFVNTDKNSNINGSGVAESVLQGAEW